MIDLKTPRGLPVNVPENDLEDPSPKFQPTDTTAIKAYYEQNGYVIVRGVYSKDTCQTIRKLWEQEVKPYNGFIYRQATAKAERHTFNDKQWVMNPILNLQSVDPRKFPEFRKFAVDRVLCSNELASCFENLLGEAPKVVQSMYFEGNSATWEHQDTYYLDSVNIGSMVAAWIAVETIDARAGRFFVCPGSHLIDMAEHNSSNNIADNHEGYIQSVVQEVRRRGLQIRAPYLEQGDVLLWNSRTIHGSLDSQSQTYARSSITCHALPNSHDFLQLQTRRFKLPTRKVNNVHVFAPKDQGRLTNRLVLKVESNFPKAFYSLKKMAIRYAVAKKQSA